ncbi:MAG TPA: SdpI family protein [Bacteroidia bacterium]|jgi:uncharacterized membrane protein|nr:SdpI family protein [Bacteroidia bacterium]
MKTQLKKEWPLWLIILSPLILIISKWDLYPDQIPTHWNGSGDIDGYGGKWALFLSPGINLAMYFLMLLLPKLDPRRKNYDLFSGVYYVIRIVLTVFLCLVGFITCLAALKYNIDVALIIQLSMIALFLILGNYFGKIRPNYFVGLRTPWTLNNEEVWMKSHRFTGKLWVICSLVMLPAIFLVQKEYYEYFFLSDLAVMVIVPIVYSWAVHKKITEKKAQ